MQGQEKPEQKGGEQPGPDKEPGSSGNAENNQQSPDENKPGQGDPNQGEKGQQVTGMPGKGTWGNLPLHMRDIFRSEGGSDMPARYRDWIDNYYRRLNKEGSR